MGFQIPSVASHGRGWRKDAIDPFLECGWRGLVDSCTRDGKWCKQECGWRDPVDLLHQGRAVVSAGVWVEGSSGFLHHGREVV